MVSFADLGLIARALDTEQVEYSMSRCWRDEGRRYELVSARPISWMLRESKLHVFMDGICGQFDVTVS